ncbi:MAG: long-chain fatty acid--CoA ligase, partial [bacterium]|nr:long-chain fatty acid--CoA ligase [bacterium]
KVVDRDGSPVPVGSVGELVVYGPHLAAGYWNDPASTQLRFRVDPTTGERALYTGDRFRWDTCGYLYFVGRDGSFIKSGGHRIGTAGLEMGLAAISGVAEACVVGVPDPELGEHVAVFVSTVSATLDDVSVREHLARLLPSAVSRPHITLRSGPLPKTRNGKLDRSALQVEALSEVHRGR